MRYITLASLHTCLHMYRAMLFGISNIHFRIRAQHMPVKILSPLLEWQPLKLDDQVTCIGLGSLP
jgi:hypothetical protein